MPQLQPPHVRAHPGPVRHDPVLSPSERQRTFPISEMARDFGVTLRALRFYEGKGMLRPRRRGTTRFYTAADHERLATILKGKEFGFSLREIREIVAAHAEVPREAGFVVPADKVSAQMAKLEAQQAEMARALSSLRAYALAMGLSAAPPACGVAEAELRARSGGRS